MRNGTLRFKKKYKKNDSKAFTKAKRAAVEKRK